MRTCLVEQARPGGGARHNEAFGKKVYSSVGSGISDFTPFQKSGNENLRKLLIFLNFALLS